jgi:hypothetical protein
LASGKKVTFEAAFSNSRKFRQEELFAFSSRAIGQNGKRDLKEPIYFDSQSSLRAYEKAD